MKRLAIALLASVSFACGGQVEDASGADLAAAQAFQPMQSFSSALTAAAKYATHPVALSLEGNLATDQKSYAWVWTMWGENGIFVDVQVSAAGTKVLSHEKRELFVGQASFDPKKIAVDPEKVISICHKHHAGTAQQLRLSAPMTRNSAPHWFVDTGAKQLYIDATTGEIQK